jgi:gas vesicle protein
MGTGANTMSVNDTRSRTGQVQGTGDAETDQQVNEIRADIAQTRAEMSETIDELQDRLNPSHLKEQLKDQVREQYEHAKETVRGATIGKVEDMVERFGDSVYETRRTITDTITANPLPSALIGIGLAWLWMNRQNEPHRPERGYSSRPRRDGRYYDYDYDYGVAGTYPSRGAYRRESTYDRTDRGAAPDASWSQRAGEAGTAALGRAQETASNLASKTRETVSGAVGQAQTTATEWIGQAQHQAQRVEQRLQAGMHDSPLAFGALALALGTAVGLAVPPTRKENEWMGEARDRLVNRAESVAHDTIEQVQEAAKKVTDEMAGSERVTSQRSSNPE